MKLDALSLALIGGGLIAVGVVVYQRVQNPPLPPGSLFSQIPPIGTPGYRNPPSDCGCGT